MAVKLGFVIIVSVLLSLALAKKKVTTPPPEELILPTYCSWSKTVPGTIECDTEFPDFSSYDPLQLTTVTGLVVANCNFVIVSPGNLQNLQNLTKLAIDCAEIVVQDGAFDGLKNLTWLSIGKSVGVLPKNLLCSLTALKTLLLDTNYIGTESDFGLQTSCSGLLTPTLCGANVTTFSASYNLLTSVRQDGFLCGLNALTELNLTKNVISTIESGAFDSVANLRRLYLGYNVLSDIPLGTFDATVNLTFLDLSYNRLSSLSNGVFKSLKFLHFINLRGNTFATLNPALFIGLTVLDGVDLSDNQLVDVTYLLTPLSKLSRVELSGNRLQKINSATFAGLIDLNHLSLDGNAIDEVANDSFASNPRLSYLSLSHNRLERIPDLSRNPFLLAVNLDHNEISSIQPTDFASNPLVLLLHLNNNKITSIGPDVFKSFVHLLRLDLSSNSIKNLDNNTFSNLVTLKYLSLQGNEISFDENAYETVEGCREMDLFKPLKSLLLLNLSDNEIVHFEYSWFPLSLINLDLSDNEIRLLPTYSLPSTPHLHTLDLSGNLLVNLTDSQFPPSVTHVVLHSNVISHIEDDTFEDLNNLESLNLRNNALATLAQLKLSNPTVTLFLRDNPWLCDCRLAWMKTFNKFPPIYDALLMKCEFLFNHTKDEETAGNVLQAPEDRFLCAFKSDTASSIYGQSFMKFDKTISKCFGPTCAQQKQCPDGCFCYHNLEWSVVKVVCSTDAGLTRFPDDSPDATDVVYVEDNRIVEINRTTFKNYETLRQLYIRKSKLVTVGGHTFTYTRDIEKIYLDHNSISSLPASVFKGLSKVTHIDLSFNNLRALPPDSFDGLAALQQLNLQNNMLTTFPITSLKSLPAVSSVGLSSNPWTCGCTFMYPYYEYVKGHKDVIDNITQLYCKPEPGQSTTNNADDIPIASFNISQCFETRLMAVAPEGGSSRVAIAPHIGIIVVSVIIIVVSMIIVVMAVTYRREVRLAIEKRFSRRLL